MANESDFAYIAANPPGGAQIPELANLQKGLEQGMGGPPQLAGQAETERAMENARQFQAQLVAKNKMAADPLAGITSAKTNFQTGEVDLKMHKDVVEAFMRDHQELNQIRGSFAIEAERIKQREDQMRSQPWVQLATALSANLAQQRDMPGWVRGMGATAAQLNPTADELRNQRLGVLNQQAQMAEKGAGLDVAELRTLMTGSKTATEEALKQRKEVDQVGQKFGQQLRLVAKGADGSIPEETVRATRELIDPNHLLSDDQVKAAVISASGLAETAKAGAEAIQGRKKDILTTASDLATQKGLTLQAAGAGQKLSLMREAFALNHGQSALDFEKAKKEVDMAISMKLAQAKSTGVISPSDSQKLQGGISTNTYLGSIGDMLSKPEFGTVAEPLFVVDRGKDGKTIEDIRINPEAALPKAWQSMNKVEADNMIKHEIPRLLSLLFKQGVGAQMFRSPAGAKILNDLGISNNMRVDQMQAVLKTIRETNNGANFQPIAVTKHGVDWANPDNAAMLAMDDPANADFWAGKGRFGGRIPVKNPTAATGGPTISKDDFDQWLKGKK